MRIIMRVLWYAWLLLLVVGFIQTQPWTFLPPMRLGPAYALMVLSVIVFAGAVVRTLRESAPAAPRWFPAVHAVSGTLAVVAFAASGIALKWRLIGGGTPAAAAVTDPTDPSQFDALRAYARRLKYDTSTHRAADSAHIVDEYSVPGKVRVLRAWIHPQRNAHLNSVGYLKGTGRDKGRVVARIRVDSAYPPLGLPMGVSYVWIDSLDQGADKFRVLFIPDQGDKVLHPPDTAEFHYRRTPGVWANFPIARWELGHSDCFNTPCGWQGCCRTCP